MSDRLSPTSILAGPILRRAEPSRVCIWLATDTDVTVRGEILPVGLALTGGPAPRGRGDLLGEGASSSLRLGENLYITLVEIRPIESSARMVFALARAQAKLCIILSGDVHYMFAQRATLIENGRPVSRAFLQLTSSAFQNLHAELNALGVSFIDDFRVHSAPVQHLGLFPRLSRVEDAPEILPEGIFVRLEVFPSESLATRLTYDRTIFRESNIGQLEITASEIRNTFWSRSLQVQRDPHVQPSPDSPVVRYRYR